MTERSIAGPSGSALPMKPVLCGALTGGLLAIAAKALTVAGSPIGPGTMAGEIVGIPILLGFPLALVLVTVGLFLRRRRPGLFAFSLAMCLGISLPFIVG